ncbi:MAG: hypothetical protein U1F36_21590 [Planctomycetota bacterium]
MSTLRRIALLVVVLPSLYAQEASLHPRSHLTASRVFTPPEGESIAPLDATQSSLAALDDGRLFCVCGVARDKHRRVILLRSEDGGSTFAPIADLPGTDVLSATVVTDGGRLCLAWSSTGSKGFSSTFVQSFDPETARFVGDADEVAIGTSDQDSYAATDLERTADGTMVVAIANHGQATRPWTCSWSMGISMRRPGESRFDEPRQFNVGSFGVWGDLQAVGDVVHASYRTTCGSSAIGSRAFDVRSGQFTTEVDVPITAPSDTFPNTCITCVDGRGGVCVIYALAATAPGQGRLMLGHLAPGAEEFNSVRIATDAAIVSGNVNPRHFSLARGPGSDVTAVWSKADDGFADLYTRLVSDGEPMGPERRIVAGQKGRFARVVGVRSTQIGSTLIAVTTGVTVEEPRGFVELVGILPAHVARSRRVSHRRARARPRSR